MKRQLKYLILAGECLALSLFLCPWLLADTVTLKNGKDVKGLIVEEHADRIILSTENGEVPIFLKGIKDIKYDELEQNLMKLGRNYEAAGKLGEALAYYEKALEVNPNLEAARKAAAGVRSRFWAASTEGPREEVEKQQILHDAWQQKKPVEELIQRRTLEQTTTLREGVGVALEKKGDWVRLRFVDPKKPAAFAGLKKNDRLISIDNQSLRYLSQEVVGRKMLLPRFSNFMLEFERDSFLRAEAGKTSPKALGLEITLEYQGLAITSVRSDSLAERAGIRSKDLLTHVNGKPTRYMPLKKVFRLIEDSQKGRVVLTIRRSTLLTRV